MMALAAMLRCCAMESATNFKAKTLSASVVRGAVMSSGTPSRGFGGRMTSSSAEDMVARLEGPRGGRV